MNATKDKTPVINVLVADDHRLFRQGLCILLEERSFHVVGEAGDGAEAIKMAAELKPDIVVMDINMEGVNGIEATRRIVKDTHSKVIALSMLDDQAYVSEMLSAGAAGYLLKDCAAEELAVAIQAVAEGKRYLSPSIAGAVVDELVKHKQAEQPSSLSELTERQVEILKLLAEGLSAQEIADSLNLSIKTVHTHRDRLMDKLKTRSIAELTKLAVREGLTSL
jgi:DNA-binding NarL/FixJ family response regulator